MYLQPSGAYYVGTEQRSRRAPFLILFSWNDYKAMDETRANCPACIELAAVRAAAIAKRDEASWQAYNWPAQCTPHTGIRTDTPKELYTYPNGKPKIWATVRQVALHQCGHWMMGSARIAGARIGISGSCGADGLPCDLQDVPKAARDRLIEVPEDVAAVYWSGHGHNTIEGQARTSMRDWAMQAFTLPVRRRR